MDNLAITKSKIYNINDFIFRQNLEFYPNLAGLSVQDNFLTYQINNEIMASEILTFDLRTLPGEVWNYSPKDFLDIVKMNKLCKNLYDFVNLLNQNIYDTNINNEETKNQALKFMDLYFQAKENFSNLTEDNKILISNIENRIATIPKDNLIGNTISTKLDEYLELTKTLGDEKGKSLALTLKNKNYPTIIEENQVYLPKAGFINTAILIYGIINIGIILAIALMK